MQPVKVVPCLIAHSRYHPSDATYSISLSARQPSSLLHLIPSTSCAPASCRVRITTELLLSTTATVAVACPGTFGRP